VTDLMLHVSGDTVLSQADISTRNPPLIQYANRHTTLKIHVLSTIR